MIRINIIFFFFCLGITTRVYSQDNIVTGKVTDDTGEGLPGVTIQVKGTTRGQISDINGSYTLQAASQDTLIFSYVGFQTVEVLVGSRSTIDILLELDIENLEEVVVSIGITEVTKSSLTGAISSVNANEIADIPVADVSQALQGRAAGVQITQDTGSPGAVATINIRGVGTINNSSPLFIVDGIIVNDINYLNSNDIAGIEVLKDAGVAALYGSRAANGVVVITTKSGGAGKTQVNVGMQFGVQDYWNTYDLMDTEEYRLMEALSLASLGGTPGALIDWNDTDFSNQVSRDWIEEISRVGTTQKFNASVSGGDEKVKYYFGSSYYNELGVVKESEFEKINGILRLDFKPHDRVNVGFNTNYTTTQRATIPEQQGSNINSIYRDALITLPNIVDVDPLTLETQDTPLRTLENFNRDIDDNILQINLSFDYKINKKLKFISRAGFGDRKTLTSRFFPNNREIDTRFQPNETTGNSRNIQTSFKWQWDNALKYDNSWNKHSLSAILQYTMEEFRQEVIFGENRSALGNDPSTAFLSSGFFNPRVNNFGAEWAQLGLVSRLAYDYSKKYLLELNFRADASSRFREGNRLGYFPAVTGGWVISEEDFMSGENWTEFLKIRAAWGRSGNNNTPGGGRFRDYRGYTVLQSGLKYGYGSEEAQIVYDGFAPQSISNVGVSWESTTTYNLGLDWVTLGGNLDLTLDAFIRETNDMLLNVPVVSSAGQTTAPLRNAGSVDNRGIEGVFTYSNEVGKFTYSITGNATYIQNEVTSLGSANEPVSGGRVNQGGRRGGPNLDFVTRTEVGQPIGSYFGWVVDGVFQTAEEANNSIQPDAQAGDFRFVDLNGDGRIDNFDRTFIGNFIPDFIYGFGVNMSYGAFDLAVFFQGEIGKENFNILNYHLRGFNGTNALAGLTQEFWRGDIFADGENFGDLESRFPPISSNDIPRPQLFDNNNRNYNRASTFYVEDGSFLRLKNLQIGYTVPKATTDRLKITRLRFFAIGTNLFTWTNYSGLDPEIGNTNGTANNLSNGIDFGSYPQARKITVGFNLDF